MYLHVKGVILMTCLVMLTACSSDDPAPAEPEALIWRSCTDKPELQCAELMVPKAYDNEAAGDISIGINRLPATTQPPRGSILLNPGGPGGSGLDMLEVLADIDTVPENIRETFDLVGFDPRGVGSSAAVDCNEFGIDDQLRYLVDDEALDAFLTTATQIATACSDKYGDYLQQLGSMNVVRDMESIRLALNEDTLNFIGYSYGTRLAGLYLQAYPDTSGAIVLDASLSPDSNVESLVAGALPALQSNLDNLLAQCTRVVSDCSQEDLLQRLINKLTTLTSTGNEEEFDLLGGLVLLGVQDPVVGDLLVAPLVSYLLDDDVTPLQEFLQFIETNFGDIGEDEDESTVQFAVLCADDATRPSIESLQASLQNYNALSDLFAEAYLTQAATCTGWPESIEPLPTISTRNAPAALVIGGTTDAQTPLAWSQDMAEAVGGYFLVSEHPGHTTVFTSQNECVDELVTNYFLEGQLPTIDRCTIDTE